MRQDALRPKQGLCIALLTLLAAVGLAGCGAAGSGDEPPEATAAATPVAVAAAGISGDPPDVDNDAPAGVCEDTANLLSRVDRVPGGLLRAVALDNRAGSDDGDGIRGVRFVVAGEGIEYTKEETAAPYCLFGGNEPDCGDWPRDEAGFYLWGVGGPRVTPGDYQVFVEVFGEQADSLSGRDRCDWSFAMRISAR